MATSIESLSIVIDVVDNYSDELSALAVELGVIDRLANTVDPIEIDVDVDTRELAAAEASLAAMRDFDSTDLDGLDTIFGDVDNRDIRRTGGGGGIRRGVFEDKMDKLREVNIDMEESLRGLRSDIAEIDVGGGGDDGLSEDARDAAAAMDDAEDSADLLNLRMSDVHNALARLVPLLLVIIGAIPALIGAFVTLAAAAIAAAGALGAMGLFAGMGAAMQRGGGPDSMMAGAQEMFEEVREDFLDAFRPLAERLAPLFEDALDGLGRLFQQIANQSDAFMEFTDVARGFGGWVMRTLPGFLRELTQFAEAVAPALGVFVNFFSELDLLRGLAGFLADVLPEFMDFMALLAGFINVLMEISIGFLAATNGLLVLFDALSQLLGLIPLTNEQFGLMVGSLLAMYGIVLLLHSALLKSLYGVILKVGTAMVSAAGGTMTLSSAMMTLSAAVSVLKRAIIGLLAMTGVGLLISLLGSVAGGFISTAGAIDEATSSLEAFQNQRQSMMSGRNPYADPDLSRGEGVGSSRFAGGQVNITVNGNADPDTMTEQTTNALYRMERTRRR